MKPISFLWTGTLIAALAIVFGTNCYDGPELVKTDAHPAFVPPEVGRPLPATPVVHTMSWESAEPQLMAPHTGLGVEKVSSSLIGTNMRHCEAGGGQQIGEILIERIAQQFPPYEPNYCLLLNSPAGGAYWQNLSNPVHHWPSGTALNDDIRFASFFIPSGTCVGFKVYNDANYTNLAWDHWRCRASWELGENWLLWSSNWQITSMKSRYIGCPSGGCTVPGW